MIRCTNENLPKVCPHKRRDLHFDCGIWFVCANWLFYFVGSPFVERCTRQKKRALKYTSNLYRLRKQRSFPHDRHLPGRGIPPGQVAVMWKDSGNKKPKTMQLGSVPLTRKNGAHITVPINRNFAGEYILGASQKWSMVYNYNWPMRLRRLLWMINFFPFQ